MPIYFANSLHEAVAREHTEHISDTLMMQVQSDDSVHEALARKFG